VAGCHDRGRSRVFGPWWIEASGVVAAARAGRAPTALEGLRGRVGPVLADQSASGRAGGVVVCVVLETDSGG